MGHIDGQAVKHNSQACPARGTSVLFKGVENDKKLKKRREGVGTFEDFQRDFKVLRSYNGNLKDMAESQ